MFGINISSESVNFVVLQQNLLLKGRRKKTVPPFSISTINHQVLMWHPPILNPGMFWCCSIKQILPIHWQNLHGVWYLVFDVQYLVFDIWWYLIFGNQIIIFLGSLVLQHNQAQTDGGLWWSLASYHQPLSIHIHLLHFLSFYSFIWIYLLWSLTSSLQPHFSYSFTSFLLDIHLFIHLLEFIFCGI